MTDKKNNQDLISGYLDDQLTPSERAQAESMLRDSKTNELLSELVNQSKQLAAVPKFSLADDFADRLLADDRIESGFESLIHETAELSNSKKPQTYPSTKRFSGAIAAIASLAAMVLITLFVPQVPMANLEVAQKNASVGQDKDLASDETASGDEFAAADKPFDSSEFDRSNLRDNLATSGEKFAKSEDDFAEEDSELVESTRSQKTDPKSMAMRQGNEKRQPLDAIEEKLKEGMSRKSRRLFEADKSRPESAFAGKSIDEFSNSIQQDNSIQNKSRGRARIATNQNEMIDQKSRAAGGLTASPEKEIQNKLADLNWSPGKSQYKDVIQVVLPGGPEKFAEFQKIMTENSVELTGNFEQGIRKLDQLGSPDFVGGAKSNAGPAGKIITKGERKAGQLSEMFVGVTATPQQMRKLVQDLNKNAELYRIGPGISVGRNMRAAQVRSANSKLDGETKEESKDKAGTSNLGVTAEEEKQDASQNAIADILEPNQLSLESAQFEAIESAGITQPTQKGMESFFFSQAVAELPERYLLIVRTGLEAESKTIESAVAPARSK